MIPGRNETVHAAGLIVLLAMGLYMASLPDAGLDTRKIVLNLYHKQFGPVALPLEAPRLARRVGNALPSLAETLPGWQKVIAVR